MITEISGRARLLPDRVNTDYIVSSSRKKESIDPLVLKDWMLETLDPGFAVTVRKGDILVAGEAFGCGSAMEVAVTVVKASGIAAVVAKSFSRAYYRNALNNGLTPVECDTSDIEEGDELRMLVGADSLTVVDVTAGFEVAARPLPGFVRGILDAGGLVPYLKTHGRFLEEEP